MFDYTGVIRASNDSNVTFCYAYQTSKHMHLRQCYPSWYLHIDPCPVCFARDRNLRTMSHIHLINSNAVPVVQDIVDYALCFLPRVCINSCWTFPGWSRHSTKIATYRSECISSVLPSKKNQLTDVSCREWGFVLRFFQHRMHILKIQKVPLIISCKSHERECCRKTGLTISEISRDTQRFSSCNFDEIILAGPWDETYAGAFMKKLHGVQNELLETNGIRPPFDEIEENEIELILIHIVWEVLEMGWADLL